MSKKNKVVEHQLGSRAIANILAALRHWQEDVLEYGNFVEKDGGKQWAKLKMPDHFADEEPFTLSEIDQLCEHLNEEHKDAT